MGKRLNNIVAGALMGASLIGLTGGCNGVDRSKVYENYHNLQSTKSDIDNGFAKLHGSKDSYAGEDPFEELHMLKKDYIWGVKEIHTRKDYDGDGVKDMSIVFRNGEDVAVINSHKISVDSKLGELYRVRNLSESTEQYKTRIQALD